jgi:hypothetical protein
LTVIVVGINVLLLIAVVDWILHVGLATFCSYEWVVFGVGLRCVAIFVGVVSVIGRSVG